MPKKKEVSKISNKIVYIFFLVGLVILLLLGFLYYQSQRPNYRDLEKAFNELTIPEGWKEVSSSSNQGTWGLFCWQIEGEACPYKIVEYSRPNDSVEKKIDLVQSSLRSDGYSNVKFDDNNCNQSKINKNNYFCKVTAEKNGIRLAISINSQESKGKPGNYAYISLSAK
jgi:hypothetical protein